MATAVMQPTKLDILLAQEFSKQRAAQPTRCPHGHYIGKRDKIAWYCRLCNPNGEPPVTKNVVLPDTRHHCDLDGEKMFANRKTEGRCPTCNSIAHVVINETWWQCADCGERYRARRRRSHADAD